VWQRASQKQAMVVCKSPLINITMFFKVTQFNQNIRSWNLPGMEHFNEQTGDYAELAAKRAYFGLVGQEQGTAQVSYHARCNIHDRHA